MFEFLVSSSAAKVIEYLHGEDFHPANIDVALIRELVRRVALQAQQSIVSEKIIFYCKNLREKSFFEGTSGNVSARLADGSILITPSSVSKDSLAVSDLVRLDVAGNLLEGWRRPSSEAKMHIAVYRCRKDINCVVHGHPPFSVAFCASGAGLDTKLLAEAALILGDVPLVKYATPSTNEVPDFLEPHLSGNNAFLLSNHGMLTLGADIEQAVNRAETLEFVAKVTAIAKGLGENLRFLSAEQLAELFRTH